MKEKRFSRSNPHLPVRNLRDTLDFYRDRLDFYEEWTIGNYIPLGTSGNFTLIDWQSL